MSKISSGQLAAAFIATRTATELTALSDTSYGNDRLWCILFARIVVLLLFLPAFFLTLRFKGDSFISAAMRRGRTLGITLGTAFALILTAAAVNTVTELQLYISDTLLEGLLPFVGAGIIAAAALYGASKGTAALTRAAIFAAAFFAVLLVLICITTAGKADAVYLYPSFIENDSGFLNALIKEISLEGELLIFAVLCSYVREKPGRTLYYTVAVLIVLEVTELLYNAVLGPYLDITRYPLHFIASLSDIMILQRLDGIEAAACLFGGVIKAALLFTGVTEIYRCCGKKADRTRFTIIYGIAALLLCLVTASCPAVYEALKIALQSGLPLIAGGTVIPLIALIFGRKKDRRENGNE